MSLPNPIISSTVFLDSQSPMSKSVAVRATIPVHHTNLILYSWWMHSSCSPWYWQWSVLSLYLRTIRDLNIPWCFLDLCQSTSSEAHHHFLLRHIFLSSIFYVSHYLDFESFFAVIFLISSHRISISIYTTNQYQHTMASVIGFGLDLTINVAILTMLLQRNHSRLSSRLEQGV